jgi:hypothetical protein
VALTPVLAWAQKTATPSAMDDTMSTLAGLLPVAVSSIIDDREAEMRIRRIPFECVLALC